MAVLMTYLAPIAMVVGVFLSLGQLYPAPRRTRR